MDQRPIDWFPPEEQTFLLEVKFKKGQRTDDNARALMSNMIGPNSGEISPGIQVTKFYRQDIKIEDVKNEIVEEFIYSIKQKLETKFAELGPEIKAKGVIGVDLVDNH